MLFFIRGDWNNSVAHDPANIMPVLDSKVKNSSLNSRSAAGPSPILSASGSTPARLGGRFLGLDVGSRTIGMAVSDLLGITAQGLQTLRRKNKRKDFGWLEKVIREYQVTEIVVGYPLRMSGLEGIQSEKMQVFAAELRKRFGLPVHLWDERLTSVEANRVLRESEMSIKRRGEVVDRLAAVLILQAFMEHRATGR
jgi:putative Holliday junction resolvase